MKKRGNSLRIREKTIRTGKEIGNSKTAKSALTTKTLAIIKFGTKSTPKIFSLKYGKMSTFLTPKFFAN